MTENLLIKLSEGLKNLADVFIDLSRQIKKDDDECFDLVRKYAELEVRCERIEKEAKQNEYDKKYFENLSRDFLEKNREKKFKNFT